MAFHPVVASTEKSKPAKEEEKKAVPIPVPAPAPKPQTKKTTGFAKGFLLGSSKKQAAPKAASVEDLSYIKAKPKEDSLRLAEIEAMKKEVTDKQSEWMTPDLLKTMWENEKVRAAMSDPVFLQAINMMKAEPKKAIEVYGKYPQLVPTLMEFNRIMSEHMEKLSIPPDAQTSDIDREKAAKQDPGAYAIETDPEVKEVLKDPRVQKVLYKLQKDGRLDLFEYLFLMESG